MSHDLHSLTERIQKLTAETRFRTALDEIFAFLDLDPNNEKANYLVRLVIFLAQDERKDAHGDFLIAEPLTEEYLGNPLLDQLFCECQKCRYTWMPNPLINALDVSLMVRFSPLGGICPECHRVFCRECARAIKSSSQASPQVCPYCRVPLSPIGSPNGRTTRQTTRRKQTLRLIIVFRQGPIPPDSEYLTELFRRLSPEVLNQNPEIMAFPVFPWSIHDNDVLRKIAGVFASQNISIDTHIIDHYYQFLDDDSNHLYIVKIYDKVSTDEETTEQRYIGSLDPAERAPFALLEVFRSHKDEDDRRAIAKAILNSGHFQQIMEQASDDDREAVLLQLSRNADCSDARVITSLVAVGSTATFNRLLFFLRYAKDHESSWRIGQEALVRLGTPILPTLLKFLVGKVPLDRKAQTRGRKRLLKILSEIGDETCVSTIRNILASDSSVQKQASNALQIIEKRIGTLPKTEQSVAETIQLSITPPTGDPYVDSCLTLGFTEVVDGREWNEYPELLEVMELVNSYRIEEGLDLAISIREEYSDFDHVYRWLALAYGKQGDYQKARQTLKEGLRNCLRKYHLCNYLALIEYEVGDLVEANRWWIQSLLLQETYEEYGDYQPFLYLAYVSQALGMITLSQRLFTQSDRIRQLRLVQKAAIAISKMAREQGGPSIVRTLELLGQAELKFGK
jgi:tetratricopeptide (TPR) repeat protein